MRQGPLDLPINPRLRLLLASSSLAALLIGGGTPAHAACSTSITGTASGCTNSTNISGINVHSATVSGSIINTGTISPNGISINTGSTVSGALQDSGALNGGIQIDATSKVVFGTTALVVSGVSFTGGISNGGTISAAATNGKTGSGIWVHGVSTFAGGITNSGTIKAGTSGAGIFVGNVGVSTFSGDIVNSGVISGNDGVQVNGSLGGFLVGRFIGNIINGAGATINSVSSAIYVHSLTTFAGSISNAGTIKASGSGSGLHAFSVSTFTGSIVNSGTISAGFNGLVFQQGNTLGGGVTNTGFITTRNGDGIFVGDVGFVNGSIINALGATIAAGTSPRTPLVATGINVQTGFTLAGSIFNGGLITAPADGISVTGFNVVGGITNAGTISVGGYAGIEAGGTITNTGSITDTGVNTLSGPHYGIRGSGAINAAGATIDAPAGGSGAGIGIQAATVTNAGTIAASTGIAVFSGVSTGYTVTNSGAITGSTAAIDVSAASSSVTINQTAGSISGVIKLSTNADVLNISGGAIAGDIVGAGTHDTINFNLGNGAFTYGAAYGFTGVNQVNINSGTVILNGTNNASTIDVIGGTLAGSGALDPLLVTVHSGATYAPGTPGTAGTSMSIIGNLVFQSGAIYQVSLNPSAANLAKVTGTVALAGTVNGVFAPGSYVSKQYTILTAAGGLGGTTFVGLTNTNLPAGASDSLSYDANDVYLNLKAGFTQYSGLNGNQENVANALTNYFNTTGGIPAQFFTLTPAGLAQLSGEVATGAEGAAFQLGDQFLNLMLNPFVNGRGYGPGAPGGGALGFAPDQQATLPDDVALAYAAILGKAQPKPSFDRRWNVWGSAYGGSNTTDGDAAAGSNNITTATYGFAAGMDYRISPNTVVGFALAGAGTNWGLANALGTGRSDALQAGAYGVTWLGRAYLAGALAVSNHWFTTSRSALGALLSANFVGQDYSARLEGGYRVGVLPTLGVTPYGAVQFQDFNTPAYSESDPTGSGLGLDRDAMNATDVRTELGSRFDAPTLLFGEPLVLYGRVAWAHDFVDDPALGAVFQTLPGGSFTVNGAPIPHDSALTSAGAQLLLAANWSLSAKFDGEFAGGSQTYAGSGTLRYTW